MIKHTSKSVFIRESSSSVIQTYYEPALDYNDYALCNPQSKNGSGLYNDLINFLNNPNIVDIKQPIEGLQKFEHYKVYPVPTSEALTIEYDFVGDNDAELVLIDLLGREVLRTSLKNSTTKVYISIKHLIQGIYMYKINVGKENYTGKIIKQ